MVDTMGKIARANLVKGDYCSDSMKPITSSQIVIPARRFAAPQNDA
jgi:hypothetical protein